MKCARGRRVAAGVEKVGEMSELGSAFSTLGICLRFPSCCLRRAFVFIYNTNKSTLTGSPHFQSHEQSSSTQSSSQTAQGAGQLQPQVGSTANYHRQVTLPQACRPQLQTGIRVDTSPDGLFSTALPTKQNVPSTESSRYALGFQEAMHV